MTENRAEAVLRPWWDVAYTYSLYSLIVAGKKHCISSTSRIQTMAMVSSEYRAF
jgi:hypothetical protein